MTRTDVPEDGVWFTVVTEERIGLDPSTFDHQAGSLNGIFYGMDLQQQQNSLI